MRKVLVFLFVLCFTVLSLAAGSARFIFADLNQHVDLLAGFLPTYTMVGAGIELPELVEGNTTELQLLVGDGYMQRVLWQDPTNGSVKYGNGWDASSALRYNVWDNEFSLRFVQGFGKSPVEDKDLVTVIGYVNTRYERYYDGADFGPFTIHGTLQEDLYDALPDYNGAVYSELAGSGHQFLGTELALSVKYDCMVDTLHTNDGYYLRAMAKYGPKFLNNYGDGFASYFTVTGNAVASKTLMDWRKNGKSLLSVVAINRTNLSYTTGEAIPSFIQAEVSLGRKVRGYNTGTYNTEWTTVNNFDVRICSPGLGPEKLAPRINLFFDFGYGWGKMFNEAAGTEYNNFLASTGAQFTMAFFDIFDLGFQVNYLFTGVKYSQPGKVTTNATFFLDF
ncbi:MAG: hypothetical protein KBS81_06245 [Spirochaetales bacterium]|nr:hypothetical protein [Candidatus Physcosoma equi]